MLPIVLVLALAAGCATPARSPQPRRFAFGKDTFAFANELAWEYFYDENGDWTSRKCDPAPEYALHCFPMARACREFFLNAKFDPEQRRLTPEAYRKQVHRIVAIDSRKSLPADQRIVIPGYADLHSFSRDHESLLKQECGSAVSSYFQRGHWRMVWPFTGSQQEQTAEQLLRGLEANWPPIIHVLVFPKLSINHAVLVFGAEQTAGGIRFHIYDPNYPGSPGTLEYDRELKSFQLPANSYFHGGRVRVYEVFRSWDY